MNEQGSKKILFNKSTLLSLKAELLKKQEEVYEKKQKPQHKLENFKPAKNTEKHGPQNNEGKRSFRDNLKQLDTEELEACRKSKAALEKKAELYEHLSDGAGSSKLGSHLLVDFSSKKQHHPPDFQLKPPPVSVIPPNLSDDEDGDSEWTEFTDCLGRNRKCLKTDLALYRENDVKLMKAITKDVNLDSTPVIQEPSTIPTVEKPILVQKTNDYLQSLRDKWEQKEKELMGKDKDIHYQDLLFDEARMHGTGYFSFSTDEAERRQQMDQLMKLREQTLNAQKVAEAERKKRDELTAARVAAARARRRLRAGLPPEDPQDIQKDFTTSLLEFLTEKKNEADNKAKEEEKKLREEQEKERQKLRDDYIREWDLGKEGVEDKKKFREMTQEEYVEQQRSKRIDEFAPPKETAIDRSQRFFDDRGNSVNKPGESSAPKTWSDVRPKVKTPPPPDIDEITDNKTLFFSSSKKNIKYRNFVKTVEPTPIVNELSDSEDDKETNKRKLDDCKPNDKEIAPPPTFDYYGPTAKHRKPVKPFNSDIREAYAQGENSLKSKESKRRMNKDYDFALQ